MAVQRSREKDRAKTRAHNEREKRGKKKRSRAHKLRRYRGREEGGVHMYARDRAAIRVSVSRFIAVLRVAVLSGARRFKAAAAPVIICARRTLNNDFHARESIPIWPADCSHTETLAMRVLSDFDCPRAQCARDFFQALLLITVLIVH